MKSFYLMVGLPKTGKTQFALRLVKYMREKGIPYHYHTDDVPWSQFVLAAKMGLSVVADTEASITEISRSNYLRHLSDDYEKTAIYMAVPAGKSKEWMKEVLSSMSHDDMEFKIKALQPLTEEEGFDSILVYDCTTGIPL